MADFRGNPTRALPQHRTHNYNHPHHAESDPAPQPHMPSDVSDTLSLS